jgi:membrane protease YdiL (CAAX protease family)
MVYWLAWCITVPLAILKPRGIKDLFNEANPRFGKHPKLAAALVFWPIMLPFATMFIPQILTTSISALTLSIVLGVTIGITEELFWRGLYTRLFPKNLWLGYLYPAVTFGLWHLAPLSVKAVSVPGGAASFVLVSVLLGLSWGYYAFETGKIRWCTTAHIINDTLGLSGIRWLPMLLAFL